MKSPRKQNAIINRCTVYSQAADAPYMFYAAVHKNGQSALLDSHIVKTAAFRYTEYSEKGKAGVFL